MKKTVLRRYSARKFSENAADLDRRSREGWNLQKPGCLRYTFEPADGPRRYALDYCPSAWGPEVQQQRRDAFAAAGWSQVGATVTGWDYYSRPWTPEEPEETFCPPLAPDPGQTRLLTSIGVLFWLRVAAALAGIAPAVVAVVRQQSMFVAAMVYLAVILLLTFRIQILQNRLKPKP